MFDLVLKQGRIVTSNEDFIGDIAIDNGTIVQISQGDSVFYGKETVDCKDKFILPGLIDLHVHFNDPGVTYREDFLTGTSAAAAGGVTLVADMPLAGNPVTTSVEALEKKKQIAREKAVVDYAIWAGLVDDNCDDLESMHAHGAYGFKAFTCFAGNDYNMATDDIILKGFHKAKEYNTFVGIHCEEDSLINALKIDSTLKEHSEIEAFLHSHGPETETISVEKMISLAETTGGHLHICHASLPETVMKVDKARYNGVHVTVETCPQYLLFTEDDLKCIGGPLKCTPPVRDRTAVTEMWKLLELGMIDFLVSDHSPATIEEKDNNQQFSKIWGGINGVQFLFPLLYTEGVVRRNFPLKKLVELCSSSPAKFIGLYPERGELQKGCEATFIIFDPSKTSTITEKNLLTKNKQSPYLGMKVQGIVESTWIQGKKVCQTENEIPEIIATPGSGRFLKRKVTGK